MAITYIDVIHCQGGDTRTVAAGNEAAVTTSPVPKNSTVEKYRFSMGSGDGIVVGYARTKKFNDTGGDYMHAVCYPRWSDLDPNKTNAPFAEAWNATTGSAHWSLRWNASGDMILLDANGLIVQTITGMFSADTDPKVRVKWKRGNNAPIKVWVDEVLKINKTIEDLQNGTSDVVYFAITNGSNPAFIEKVYHGTAAFAMATLEADAVFEGEVVATRGDGYMDTSQGSASQWTGTDALNTGRWDNMDDILTSTEGSYSFPSSTTTTKQGGVTTDDGARLGPKGHLGSTAIPFGAQWLWEVERTGGSGFRSNNIKFSSKHGRQVVGSEATDNTVTTLRTLANATKTFFTSMEFNAGGVGRVPAYDEYFQIGIKGFQSDATFTAGVLHCYRMQAFLFIGFDFIPPPSSGFVYVGSGVMPLP